MKKMLKRLCTGFLALATVVTALPTSIDFTLYYLGDCWYFPNRQNKKYNQKNLSNIERNEVKHYGNEICRARYGTVFLNS